MPAPLRLRIPEVQDPDLAVDASFGSPAQLKLVGSADSGSRLALGDLLDRLHKELVGLQAKEIVVDLRSLDAMSAGCMNELIRWIGNVQDGSDVERYKLRILVNRSMPWQTSSMKALSCFDTDLVTIEEKA